MSEIIEAVNKIIGKVVYKVNLKEKCYHYERQNKGYDHLGSLGYENVKVVDEYEWEITKIEVKVANLSNVLQGIKRKKVFENYEDAENFINKLKR